MFIRSVQKKNKKKDKIYTYYRLTHSYRVGNKSRQIVILNLGKLEGLDKAYHKVLASRIEELVTGVSNLFVSEYPKEIEALAQGFAKQISKEKIFTPQKGKAISKEIENRYQSVDLDTLEQLESKSIGGEWLIKQAFDRLGFASILQHIGLDEKQVDVAQLLLTAKLLHPSSELETERWLEENSAAASLYNDQKCTRYLLYQVATKLYDKKIALDKQLYSTLTNLFSKRSKIVIYDLTNIHFEGQMLGSEKVAFGKSKQKRNDRRLIGLALAIDALGFVRESRFYKGNVSEPSTFIEVIESLISQLSIPEEKPLIVMDAGIATEDNLTLLRNDPYNYDYVCVSRSIPKQYEKLSETAKTITDNRGHKIHLTKISVTQKPDHFLHIKSDQKQLKEISMDSKLTLKLEAQLESIKKKLPKKGTLKKTAKVHEKIGAIKSKLSRVGHLYQIDYVEDTEKGIVTDINWKRIKEKERPKGEYFLRYTKNAIAEDKIWDAYNLTREVEAVFRCLKTDLNIRPIYHQKDAYIEPHIWLGILAYQVVNYIRRTLKQSDINYSWTRIVQKMNTIQSSTITLNNDQNQKLYAKLCTRPTKDQEKIFDALNFKHRPFVRKTKVVT